MAAPRTLERIEVATRGHLRTLLLAAASAVLLVAAAEAFLRPPPPPAPPGPLPEVASQPQFIDARHGWLYMSRASGIGLYGTDDGGAHWTRRYARSSGAFHFFDDSNGVLFDSDGWVELTSDGGRSWHIAGLVPAYSNVTVAALAFFGDSRRGVALVWRPDDTAAVLVTDDVVHWRLAGRIPLSQPFALAANSEVALLVASGRLLVTNDGGLTWAIAEFRDLRPTSVTLEGDSLVVGSAMTDDGVNWHPGFPPLSLAPFHDPNLFYAADGTPFVLDNFMLDRRPDTRLFVAAATSWRLVKLP